jgi:hypothetical protein
MNGNVYVIAVGNLKDRDKVQDAGVNCGIILKWILK